MTRKANPVIVGGVVRGTWVVKKDKKTNKRNEIAVAWLDEMPPPRKAVDQEAQRLTVIVGDDLRLTLEM
jgi:hypothetical protein